MDKIIEIILSVLVTQFDLVLDWIKNRIHESETGYDDKLLRVICFTVVEFEKEIIDFASKSETNLDDKVVEKIIAWAKVLLDPKHNERELAKAAVEAGLVVKR
jgi:hypothetical protein